MPALLYVRLPSLPADVDEAAWSRWYDDEHMRYRFDKPGFGTMRRYRVVDGAQRTLALYELESPAALTTPAYLAHRDWETAQPVGTFEALGPRLPGFARGVYESKASYSVPDATVMRISGYDATDPETADAFAEWCAETGVAALRALPGVAAARHLRLTANPLDARSGVASGKPRDILMCDLLPTNLDLADALDEFDADVASRFGNRGLRVDHTIAERVFIHRAA
jgi:hypothetical protein